MPDRTPAAVGLIRLDIPAVDIDLHILAERNGCRLLYTVKTNARPFVTAHALARYAAEYDARAVIVPGIAHADAIRHIITENAALITPRRVYPRGYRWDAEDLACHGES
ncbi:hypothetical protein [Nocardia carnea]|uniref:hypothetical protein n=1 Tax=Nocardia carnea TaxID=37328 RepID=UPI002458DD87|nr:hypothetical protein [Nocardia carnea]